MWFRRKRPDDKKWKAMNDEVMALAKSGRMAEALPLGQKLFRYSRGVYGRQHEKTVSAVNNLGFILMQKGDFNEAESYLLMALQVSECIYGRFSHEVYLVNMNLSRLYARKAEAIRNMNEAYESAARVAPVSQGGA